MKVSRELRDFILKNMPSNLTDLEKAIYIYIKLCKTLSYKMSYYAFYKKDDGWEDRLCNITPSNNEVVCYEFATILKLLFDVFNFNSSIYSKGLGHKSVMLYFDDYNIDFDSTQSIIYSDMLFSKVNDELLGITLRKLGKSFNDDDLKVAIEKVYKIIKFQESAEIEKRLNDIKNTVESNPNIDQDEVVKLFKTSVENTLLTGVDNLGYMLLLNDILSPEKKLLRVNFMGCFIEDNGSKKASAGAVIGVNKKGFEKRGHYDNSNTTFYWYHDDCGLINSSEESIFSGLSNHELYLCNDETGPGLTKFGMFAKVPKDSFLTPYQVSEIVDSSKSK